MASPSTCAWTCSFWRRIGSQHRQCLELYEKSEIGFTEHLCLERVPYQVEYVVVRISPSSERTRVHLRIRSRCPCACLWTFSGSTLAVVSGWSSAPFYFSHIKICILYLCHSLVCMLYKRFFHWSHAIVTVLRRLLLPSSHSDSVQETDQYTFA